MKKIFTNVNKGTKSFANISKFRSYDISVGNMFTEFWLQKHLRWNVIISVFFSRLVKRWKHVSIQRFPQRKCLVKIVFKCCKFIFNLLLTCSPHHNLDRIFKSHERIDTIKKRTEIHSVSIPLYLGALWGRTTEVNLLMIFFTTSIFLWRGISQYFLFICNWNERKRLHLWGLYLSYFNDDLLLLKNTI